MAWFGIPTPGTVLRLPALAVQAVTDLRALVPQLAGLVGDLQDLVGETRAVIRDAHATQQKVQQTAVAVERTRQFVQDIAERAAATGAAAAAAVQEIAETGSRAQELVDQFEPALHTLAPLTAEVAQSVSQDDAAALIDVLHTAPALVDKIATDIVPALDSLDTVAPDLREVLNVSAGMNEMLGSIPGLGKVKRRIEHEQQDRREHDSSSPSS